jgi:hypothetical protein
VANRVMRDSTVLADIPVHGTDIVAPYVNGRYASTLTQVRARFPTAGVAWIDVNGTHPENAQILDVEQGDATPAEAALWARARHILHPHAYPPIIYCNRSTLTPVFNAMATVGLKAGAGFRLWIATLDGTKAVKDMTGVTAVQYAGQAQTGGHYDESIVYDPTWLAAPAPVLGVTRYTADGKTSLLGFCAAHGIAADDAIALMVLGHPDHQFGSLQAPYIVAGDWSALMPAGMTCWA